MQALSLLEEKGLCGGWTLQGCYGAGPEGAVERFWLFLLPTFLPHAFGPRRLLRELSVDPARSSLVQDPCLPQSCPWQLPPNPTPPCLVPKSTAQPSVLQCWRFLDPSLGGGGLLARLDRSLHSLTCVIWELFIYSYYLIFNILSGTRGFLLSRGPSAFIPK